MIFSYHFKGSKKGPKIYLQANLHGPEIFGTFLLGNLINYLENKKDFPGEVIVVPCANPIAVNSVAYNSIIGRYNLQSGKNWNRNFDVDAEFKDHGEEKKYYVKQLKESSLPIEKRISAILKLISSNAGYIIDIHTSGSESIVHLFTFAESNEVFLPLKAQVHINLNYDGAVGAFDESKVVPFVNSLSKSELPHVCTWEASRHGHMNQEQIGKKTKELIRFLESVWVKNKVKRKVLPKIFSIDNSDYLVSPASGYYCWRKNAGTIINKGEVFAEVYQPSSNKRIELRADFKFILIAKYGIGAIGRGEQIGWMARY